MAPPAPPPNNKVVIKQFPAALAPPETILFEAKNGNVTFTHRKHYERVKNQCDTCHPKIFTKSRDPINYKKANHRVAEATYTSCATCHAVGATSFAADSNCQKCHANKYE
jgi:c(7)-type cytochrome triheme protein